MIATQVRYFSLPRIIFQGLQDLVVGPDTKGVIAYQKEKSSHPISKWKSVMRDLCTQIGLVLQEGIAARSIPGYAGAYRPSCSAWQTAPL